MIVGNRVSADNMISAGFRQSGVRGARGILLRDQNNCFSSNRVSADQG